MTVDEYIHMRHIWRNVMRNAILSENEKAIEEVARHQILKNDDGWVYLCVDRDNNWNIFDTQLQLLRFCHIGAAKYEKALVGDITIPAYPVIAHLEISDVVDMYQKEK